MRRGLTLLELLISLVIVVVVTISSTRAYEVALTFDQKMRAGRDLVAERQNFESTVTDLLHHAWISSSATNLNSYFIGGMPQLTAAESAQTGSASTTTQTAGGTSPGSAAGATGGGGSGAYGTPNTIVFTAAGLPISADYLASNDDSETQNQNFGPQGGIREIEISQTAVGTQGQSKTGVFLRVQTPADDDPTQGGNENLITSKLTQLGFEFFDGTQWDPTWDTRGQTPLPGHMPAAVRITYRFQGDDYDHVLIVQIPGSDVSYLNPVTVTGGS